MTIPKIITNLLAHFSPLSMAKPINPFKGNSAVFAQPANEKKPWMNADEIELIQEDFA